MLIAASILAKIPVWLNVLLDLRVRTSDLARAYQRAEEVMLVLGAAAEVTAGVVVPNYLAVELSLHVECYILLLLFVYLVATQLL